MSLEPSGNRQAGNFMSRRKALPKIPKNTVENRKRGLYVNVLGRPRKNNWGTRFNHSVALDISRDMTPTTGSFADTARLVKKMEPAGMTPITRSFAERIITAKTGDAMRGFALINGKTTKITVYIYY